jgi:predicted DsbA family dithiol-disulfide isomerase
VGAQEGISFSYGGLVGNTLNSHRLIAWAEKQGKQDQVCGFESIL